MKTSLFSLLAVVCVTAITMAADAPKLSREADRLDKQVKSDLAAGMLTKADADELKVEIDQVRNIETSEPTLTRKTRRDLQQKIEKIRGDIKRMEDAVQATKAGASATPQ